MLTCISFDKHTMCPLDSLHDACLKIDGVQVWPALIIMTKRWFSMNEHNVVRWIVDKRKRQNDASFIKVTENRVRRAAVFDATASAKSALQLVWIERKVLPCKIRYWNPKYLAQYLQHYCYCVHSSDVGYQICGCDRKHQSGASHVVILTLIWPVAQHYILYCSSSSHGMYAYYVGLL